MKQTGWWVGLALLLVWPLGSQAGTAWSTARVLNADASLSTAYGQLASVGSVHWYRLGISQPTTLRAEIGTSTATSTDFSPRLAVFQPSSATVGPLLPIPQPPQTTAMVYAATNTADETFDGLTQIVYSRRLDTTISLPVAGTYYLAVYNAGPAAGQYRLLTNHPQTWDIGWSELWQLPVRWWQDQAFAGWTWRTTLTPLLLAVLIVLVIEQLRYYHLHHLAPARRPPAKPRKGKA